MALPGNVDVSTPKSQENTADKLRVVVQNWGREVTGAQARLEAQIRAASSELSLIEDLLTQRMSVDSQGNPLPEIERLRAENESLRRSVADRDRQIRELSERLNGRSPGAE